MNKNLIVDFEVADGDKFVLKTLTGEKESLMLDLGSVKLSFKISDLEKSLQILKEFINERTS